MPFVKEIGNFAIQVLVFKEKLLNDAHSITDIKYPSLVLQRLILIVSCSEITCNIA